MKWRSEVRSIRFTLPLILATALVPCGTARAFERDGYAMEILVDGIPVSEYAARGARYVEALKGREYSIRLRNSTGARVAIALSVDGLNSIDARTTSMSEARKWVLEGYETITLAGWQTSPTTARRFVFTTEPKSYGAWLGRTENLGVIAAAVFRERRLLAMAPGDGDRRDGAWREPAGEASPQGRLSPEAGAERELDDLAATGIGRETSHPVRLVNLDLEDSPAALLEMRYEYHDALVRLGVLPSGNLCEDSLARRERGRGFTDQPFAPDPYRRQDRRAPEAP
ncbi:MAG TPA: hypothetical protein VFB95_10095 [Candidatus Cryosericum sp.]|nr:hypothetical protein [Candidatus Cryosericum sp.]